jgi:prepilin-type N-terminal cleavage/methylation domain-containing protein
VTPGLAKYARSQNGFTLVEVVIAGAIGVVLMTALTSVILTASRGVSAATSRIEASGQIRIFESFANDDFAQSTVPAPPSGCGTTGYPPCTTQPIPLSGTYAVSYVWDNVSGILSRAGSGSNVIQVATNVSGFSWYVDRSALHPTVVITLTVTVQAYSESQTFRFEPQVNP